AAADEVAQVKSSGAVLQPGVVAGGADIAELEAPPAAAGDLGDHPFDVGPVCAVVLAQGGLSSPGSAGGPQDRIAGVQVQGPPGFGGGARSAQRGGAAGGAEDDSAAGGDGAGDTGRAGHRAGGLVNGEVIGGEPAVDGGPERPRL